MSTQRERQNAEWQAAAALHRSTVSRACPVCPASSGVLDGERCPACNRAGKVNFAPGDRVATRFLEQASKADPKLSANNRRRYRVSVACTALPENAAPEVYALAAKIDVYVWAYSSERAMVQARDAAIWDGVPRPFEVTVSRSFLVEDEVIQKTRSTCDEDKGDGGGA